MRRVLKRVASLFLIPITKWYLRRERNYHYKSLDIVVSPGVFHPGLFYSTKFLLSYLEKQNLKDQAFLELGCGTGLISIVCARHGARVVASDLSTRAIANAQANSVRNNVQLQIIHSNLFEKIPNQKFDWIIINPPYYAKEAKSEAELAWNCGKEFQYFYKLFGSMSGYMQSTSNVIMVLTLGCDIARIKEIGATYGFQFEVIAEKNVLFDGKDFLFRIS